MHKGFLKKIYKVFVRIVGQGDRKTIRSLFRIIQAALYAIVIAVFINLLSFFGDDPSFGQFGDFLGGTLNPILTFLMLLGLLITIAVQRSELNLTREEFKRSADALHEQKESLKKQVFENTFFNMLRLYNEVVGSLVFVPMMVVKDKSLPVPKYEGRRAITHVYNEWKRMLAEKVDKDGSGITRKDIAQEAFGEFFEKYGSLVGHYFRTLYHIINLVDKSGIDDIDKKFYVDIVKSQISSHELAFLFYNCTVGFGKGKFLNVAKKYTLFEHLQTQLLSLEDDVIFIK